MQLVADLLVILWADRYYKSPDHCCCFSAVHLLFHQNMPRQHLGNPLAILRSGSGRDSRNAWLLFKRSDHGKSLQSTKRIPERGSSRTGKLPRKREASTACQRRRERESVVEQNRAVKVMCADSFNLLQHQLHCHQHVRRWPPTAVPGLGLRFVNTRAQK